jgi:hypothetical protein
MNAVNAFLCRLKYGRFHFLKRIDLGDIPSERRILRLYRRAVPPGGRLFEQKKHDGQTKMARVMRAISYRGR